MLALARKIVSEEEEEEAETVEAVFAQARDAEAVAEEYLVDDGWKAVEVEPPALPSVREVVEAHRNGNGHTADGNGANHAGAVVASNGHCDEAAG